MYIGYHVKYTLFLSDFNPYPANVENMVSSEGCQQIADGI